MAMPVDAVDDDHWPSLAPIRTSASTACLHACDTICKSPNLEDGSLHTGHGAPCGDASSKSSPVSTSCVRSAPFNARSPSERDRAKAADTDLARQSSCCYTSKKTCVDLFSCFSCTKQTSSPRPHRRCTPTCMRKNGPVLRSMAFLFPTGGFQSFYSSPTGKAAQLSGAFPRTLSAGKLQHYASPRTPGNHSVSGKIQHFSSPRTPGSGNLQCLSAPRTPATGKVQHFSGAIPSPRTPFGSGAASPSSARRRKSSFTLFMPPATEDKKKAGDQLDEPTSPHVTCIGRVRRQTHCKKLHYKDMINTHAHCHDNTARKKGTYSKKLHSNSGSSKSDSISSNEGTKSCTGLSTLEACKQKFGRNQLHNLHKIHGFDDESSKNPDRIALDCNHVEDITPPVANGHKDLMHQLDSQNHGRHSSLSNVECMNGDMSSLQQAAHGFSSNIKVHSEVDNKAEVMEYNKVESVDCPVLHTTYSHSLNDLQQEAHQSQCLEILNELQHEAHDQSQCEKLGSQLDTSKSPRSTDHYLLLMRNTSGRKLPELDISRT